MSTQMDNEEMISYQLLSCCTDELPEAIYSVSSKNEKQLLGDMHRLAVVAQNNLVNTVKRRSRSVTVYATLPSQKLARGALLKLIKCWYNIRRLRVRSD